jgi:hypothetical protein
MGLQKVGRQVVDWIRLAWEREKLWAVLKAEFRLHNVWECFTKLGNIRV